MKLFKNGIVLGGILGFLSVLLGAFGAHGLKPIISPNAYDSFETAVNFQFFHGIVIILLSMYQNLSKTRVFKRAIQMLLLGTVLFSFSIYFITIKSITGFGSIPFLWVVTPLGGTILIISWFMIILAGIKMRRNAQ